MEYYFVLSILDRDKRELQEKIYQSLGLSVSLTALGRGTATADHLTLDGLSPTPKALMATVADAEHTRKLFHENKLQLFIDIPGNGITLAIPVKSVGGAATLSALTDNQSKQPGKPKMKFQHEMIWVIANEGHSEEIMAAARPAGAAGGTVIAAKGTGLLQNDKFRDMSLANEKEAVLIVARAEKKAAIMRAIMEQAGVHTRAGAICFSLPVSSVAGLRRAIDPEEE